MLKIPKKGAARCLPRRVVFDILTLRVEVRCETFLAGLLRMITFRAPYLLQRTGVRRSTFR